MIDHNREFYNQLGLDDWVLILGEDLHYHFGFFDAPSDGFQEALRRAVRVTYRWIPDNSSVLDLGAGWGAPARLLAKEKGCFPCCVTSSDEQAKYIGQTPYHVVQADLERPLPFKGTWDVALMLESLEHVRKKEQLLGELRGCASRLILRVNCTSRVDGEQFPDFGATMFMPTQAELLSMLQKTGWRVRFVCNQRQRTFLSLVHWNRGINKLLSRQPSSAASSHLMALFSLCNRGLLSPNDWLANNPLIDIVAD